MRIPWISKRIDFARRNAKMVVRMSAGSFAMEGIHFSDDQLQHQERRMFWYIFWRFLFRYRLD